MENRIETSFPLSSGQIYLLGTVFCEHRTKPEFPCVCSLATIRL